MSGTSGESDGSVRDLTGDLRGQSETIGVVLILGMVTLGMTAVIGFGSQALDATEQRSEVANAEQSMAQFDSKAAQVALGDSAVQSVPLGSGGQYTVREDAGWIRVEHINHTGSGDDETIYNGTLGAVVYESEGTTIAYQGGGVWRRDVEGNSTMISPPEFHYREGTLTLPVIRAESESSDGASGSVSATVTRNGSFVQEFPNSGESYRNSPQKYTNPIQRGSVNVTVRSQYYHAWAEYFRTRTDGNVTVEPATETVTLELLTLGQTGPFPMPNDNGDQCNVNICVRGLANHSLTEFEFTIYPKDNQQSEFKNLRWSMYVDEGDYKFEVALGGSGSYDCGDSVPVSIYLSNDSHSSYEGWQNAAGVTVDCPPGQSRPSITLDLTDENIDMKYTTLSGSDLSAYKSDIKKNAIRNPGEFVAHPSLSGEPETYNLGNTEDVSFIVDHYFSLMGPDFELQVSDQQKGGAAGVDEDDSFGSIDYDGDDRVVRYLHITENPIEIGLN